MDPIKLESSHNVLCKEEIKQEIAISGESIQYECIKDEDKDYGKVQGEVENWTTEALVNLESQENVPKEENCINIKTEVADKLLCKKPRKPRKRAKRNKIPKEQKIEIAYPRKCDHCSYSIPKRADHYRHYMFMHGDIIHEYPYGSVKVACSFCGRLISPTHLKDHELIHGEKTFKCSICPSAFHNNTKLKRHLNNVHSDNRLICDYCSKGFKSREDLTRHIRIHTGEKPFKCHVCAADFAHSGNRSIHMRTAHQIMQYIAPQIKHESTKIENYSHNKIEIEIGIPFQKYPDPKYTIQKDIKLPKKYECKICYKTIQAEDYKDLCNYCSKQSAVKEEIILSNHVTTPSPDQSPKYSPQESQDPLNNYDTYDTEIQNEYVEMPIEKPELQNEYIEIKVDKPETQKEFIEIKVEEPVIQTRYIQIKVEDEIYTQTCSYSTYAAPHSLHKNSLPKTTSPTRRKIRQRKKRTNTKKAKLEKEIKTGNVKQEKCAGPRKRKRKRAVDPNAPQYPRKCDHCNYNIEKRCEHYRHYMFMHGDILHEYPYPVKKSVPCSFCGVLKAFNRIKEHELTHGEKTFKCELCTKAFHNNVQLRKHMDSVHSEKRMICHYCSKPFKTREVIIRHLRVHTGEKPYKCHICNAGFAHSGNRTVHVRIAHQNSTNKTNKQRNKKNINSDAQLMASYRKRPLTNADYTESFADFAELFHLSESISQDSRLMLGETAAD